RYYMLFARITLFLTFDISLATNSRVSALYLHHARTISRELLSSNQKDDDSQRLEQLQKCLRCQHDRNYMPFPAITSIFTWDISLARNSRPAALNYQPSTSSPRDLLSSNQKDDASQTLEQ